MHTREHTHTHTQASARVPFSQPQALGVIKLQRSLSTGILTGGMEGGGKQEAEGTGWAVGISEKLPGGRRGHSPGGLFVCFTKPSHSTGFPGLAEPSPPDPVGSTSLGSPRRGWGGRLATELEEPEPPRRTGLALRAGPSGACPWWYQPSSGHKRVEARGRLSPAHRRCCNMQMLRCRHCQDRCALPRAQEREVEDPETRGRW